MDESVLMGLLNKHFLVSNGNRKIIKIGENPV
jgi:hypothetical protein